MLSDACGNPTLDGTPGNTGCTKQRLSDLLLLADSADSSLILLAALELAFIKLREVLMFFRASDQEAIILNIFSFEKHTNCEFATHNCDVFIKNIPSTAYQLMHDM